MVWSAVIRTGAFQWEPLYVVCGQKDGNHREELSNAHLKQKVKPAGVSKHLQRHPDCCRENKAVTEAAESAHFYQFPQLTDLFLKLKTPL